MPARFAWCRRSVVIFSVLEIACGEPGGPSVPADPAAATLQLRAIDSVFASLVLQTQNYLGLLFQPPRDQTGGPRLFDPAVLGHTFEWDPPSVRYVSTTRAGAPAGGARAILYALDGFISGLPAQPLSELGATDLVEGSAGGRPTLQAIVQGPGGGPVYANYRVGGAFGTAAFSLTAEGFVANDGKRLELQAAFAADNSSATFDISLELRARGLAVRSIERFDYFPGGYTATIDYRLRYGRDAVLMIGPVTVTEVTPGVSSTRADVDFLINGRVFARIRGTNEGIALRGPDGEVLTTVQGATANRLFRSPGQIHGVVGALLQPQVNVLSGY